MAGKLKVEELRTELAQRGLSTTGTKPSLVLPSSPPYTRTHIYTILILWSIFSQVRRLETALRKENKERATVTDEGDASENKKRGRDSENGGSQKIKAVEEFRGMGIRQLREQAALRGVSSIGSKKELLERLCEDSKDQDLEEIPEGMEESLNLFYVISFFCCV